MYSRGWVRLRQTELFRKASSVKIVGRHRRTGIFTAMDGLRAMRAMRPGIADIVFLDPPFNLGKDYGIRSSIEAADPRDYEVYMTELLDESARVLKEGGALFLYHVPYWASRLSKHLQSNLEFRHWISVSMKNGFVRGRNLYPAHYALLYYTRGNASTFNRPKLTPITCRHCGELVKDYGGYTDIIRAKGINLSDVWDDLSPVRHKSTKLRSANQLPVQLTNRVLDIAGAEGGLLVDPFIGSGTSAISAQAHSMSFVGNDLSRRNIALSLRRLAANRLGD
jgi:site-specific DNA-methyltransferase (adenine-specific)